MTTDPIVAFIEARLRDEELTAQAATPGPWEARAEPNAAHSTLYGEADVFTASGQPVAADSDGGCADMVNAVHIARFDPRRVLADVEAKRAIAKSATLLLGAVPSDPNDYALIDSVEGEQQSWLHDVLIPLARVWSDHPDFDPSWAS